MNGRIRELRKLLDMNQTDFGAKIGLSQKSVTNMEAAGGTVTDRNFNAICKAFHVNPDWLKHGVGEIFVETREALIQSLVDEFDLSPNEAVLLKTFLELPAEHRKGVLNWAENFARTMALQLGVEYPQREEMPEHPTTAQKREIVNRELDEEDAAAKRGTTTSSASIGSSGSKRKFGNSS